MNYLLRCMAALHRWSIRDLMMQRNDLLRAGLPTDHSVILGINAALAEHDRWLVSHGFNV